jgi:hypothetical protein
MKNWLLLLTLPFILAINAVSAEPLALATVMKGQVVTNNPSSIQVLITERDGSILDMTNISADGVYKLDLTIMDNPSHSEVKKLIIEVKSKSGTKRKYAVKKYLNTFGDTVLLRPIIFN